MHDRLVGPREDRFRIPPPLPWHERIRCSFDFNFLLFRIRSWPNFVADLTYRGTLRWIAHHLYAAGFLDPPNAINPLYPHAWSWWRWLTIHRSRTLQKRSR